MHPTAGPSACLRACIPALRMVHPTTIPPNACQISAVLADPKNFLRVMEAFWAAQKEAYAHPAAAPKPPAVISRQPGSCGSTPEFDLVVAGGTLGVLVALALQRAGHRVAIVERRLLQGRNQGEGLQPVFRSCVLVLALAAAAACH